MIVYKNQYYNIIDVIGDGSCFFHVLLYNLSSLYKQLNLTDKKRYAQFIRTKLKDEITIDIWKSLHISSYYYNMYISHFISDMSKKYKIDTDILKIHVNGNSIYNLKNININNIIITMDDIETYIYFCLKQYKNKLTLYTEWVSDELFEYISYYFKINLLFIDSHTNNEYKTGLSNSYNRDVYFYCLRDSNNEFYHYQYMEKISI